MGYFMGYISEKAMGNSVKKFLEQRDVYNLNNYKNAYNACKMRCHKISGKGKTTRHVYDDGEIEAILIDWYVRY